MPDLTKLMSTQEPIEVFTPEVGTFLFHIFQTQVDCFKINMLPPSGSPVFKDVEIVVNLRYRLMYETMYEIDIAIEHMINVWLRASIALKIHGLQEAALFVEDQDE